MKKSFLKTCILLCFFSIFLIGDTDSVFAQENSLYDQNIILDDLSLKKVETAELSATSSNWFSNGLRAFQLISNPAGFVGGVAGTAAGAAGVAAARGQDPLAAAKASALESVPSVPTPLNWIAQGTIMPLIQTGTVFALKLIQFTLWSSGLIFDKIIDVTIGNQDVYRSFEDSISVAWKIIRDIANIFIVFALLYLGIKTIFNGNGFAETKTLISIIIAAILINFSLLLTQTVYQVSNTIGAQIGEQITFTGKSTGYGGVKSISSGLMGMISPQNIMNTMWTDKAQSGWSEMWNRVQVAVLVGLIMLMLAVVLFAASILLMYRFIVFIVLMITSPIGVTSKFVPWFSGIGEKWWSTLKSQALVLPAFLLTLYISILFVAPLAQNLNGNAFAMVASGRVSDPTMMTGAVIFIFNFLLIIGFLLLPLIVPGKIGAAGSDMMTGVANWTTNKIKNAPKRFGQRSAQVAAGGTARAGRVLGGKLIGGGITKNETLKRWATDPNNKFGSIARATMRAGEGLKNSSFDVRNTTAGAKLGIGKGVESWNKAVATKKAKIEERKKKEEKLLGYDKMEDAAEVATATAERDAEETKTRQKENALKQTQITYNSAVASGTVTQAHKDAMTSAQEEYDTQLKELENKELAVGKAKNKGDVEYMKLVQKRRERLWNRMSATQKAAIEAEMKELEKKWKNQGQSSRRKRNNPTVPTPTPPVTPPPII